MNVQFTSLERNEQLASITLDFNWELSCGLFQLRLVRSYFWLEFRRLDTRCSWLYPTFDSSSGDWIRVCGWFYPASGSSSAGWIQVAVDSILWLTCVSAAEYDLRLLNTSCGWFYPTADSYSGGWIRVADDSILWLTASYSWFHPTASYKLWVFYPAADSRSAVWIRHTADLYFNISSKFKDWFCKINHFYSLFSTCWFQYHWFRLWHLLQEPWRSLKKLEEAWRSFKTLAATNLSCNGRFETCDQSITSGISTPISSDKIHTVDKSFAYFDQSLKKR